jgi:DNA-binding XRE family transcriptional regulator
MNNVIITTSFTKGENDMAKAPKKGVAGKKTGGAARKAIKAAKKRGCTTEQIAKAARRDPSTINEIENGGIKNPPANLAKNVAKCKGKK